MAAQKTPQSGDSKRRGGRRWLRRLSWALAALVVAGVITGAVLSRSRVIGQAVATHLESILDADVKFSTSRLTVSGSVIVDGIEMRARQLEGPPGRVLRAKRVVVDLSLRDLIRGQVKPRGMRIEQPVVRISQSKDGTTLNLAALVKDGGEVKGTGRPPRIDAVDAVLEIGEHEGATYDQLKVLRVGGSLSPIDPRLPVYSLLLQETKQDGSDGLLLRGAVDLQQPSVNLTLLDVALHEWTPDTVPSSIRDLWETLAIEGRIDRATFNWNETTGVAVKLLPDSISISPPVPAGRPDETDRVLRLSYVNGEISLTKSGVSADLVGLIEDQSEATEVRFQTFGTSLNSGVSCRIDMEDFVISEEPGLLRFAPEMVREQFQRFKGSSTQLDAHIHITRADPTDGVAAPFETQGSILLKNGKFEYGGFPYPLEEIAGNVTFTERSVEVVNVTGVGPTGARFQGEGQFDLVGEDKVFRLTINGFHVPVDDVLERALEARTGDIAGILCDEEAYASLLEQELVLKPETHDRLKAELQAARVARARLERGDDADGVAAVVRDVERLETLLETPRFDFRGDGSIRFDLTRTEERGWAADIRLTFEKLGLLPRPFPYPIHAKDVVVRIANQTVTIERGTFAGIAGGTAEVSAHIPFADELRTPDPDLTIAASRIPVDALLVNAIPSQASDDSDALEARSLVTALGVEGHVDSVAEIDIGKDVSYAVRIGLDTIRLRPEAPLDDATALIVDDVSGTLIATNNALELRSCSGTLLLNESEASEARRVGELGMAMTLDIGSESQAMTGSLELRDYDLGVPGEGLVGIVSDEVAERLADVRATYAPAGHVDATVNYTTHADGQSVVDVTLQNIDEVSFDLFDDRVALVETGGQLRVRLDGDRTRLFAEGIESHLEFGGAPVGVARADGFVSMGDGETLIDGPSDITVSLSSARVEHPVMPKALASFGVDHAHMLWGDHMPAGEFDFALRVGGEGLSSGSVGRAPEVAMRLMPRSLSFRHDEHAWAFGTIDGAVDWYPGKFGRFAELEVRADDWAVELDGGWEHLGPGEVSVDTTFAIDAEQMSPDLRAVLPAQVRDFFSSIDLEFPRAWFVRDGHLSTVIRDETPVVIDTDCTVHFAEASADIGLAIERANGSVAVDFSHPEGASYPTFQVEFGLEEFEIGGVSMTNGRGLVRSGERSGNIVCPYAAADCHGGRAWASALYSKLDDEEDGPRGYELDLRLNGVSFPDLLADLREAEDGTETVAIAVSQPEPDIAPLDDGALEDASLAGQGTVDATLSLAGIGGEPGSRAGKGAMRVVGEDVIRLPLLFPLMQLSTLQVPSADRLDYLQTQFHVVGSDVTFEHIAVLAETISLLGSGRMNWDDKRLELAFNSKSNRRIPIVTDVFEMVRDEIVTTTIVGTVDEPVIGTRPLTGTTRFIDNVLGTGDGEQLPPTDLPEAERRARAERSRLLTLSQGPADAEVPEDQE